MKSKRKSGRKADNSNWWMCLLVMVVLSACGSEKAARLTEFGPLKHQLLPCKAMVKEFEERKMLLAEQKLKKVKPTPMIRTFIAFNY